MSEFLSALFPPRIIKSSGQREDKTAYPIAELKQIAKWAYRFSPLVSPDMPQLANSRSPSPPKENSLFPAADPRYNGINLEISGSRRLFKGEENLLQEVKNGFASLGLRSRIAIAPTLGCAWALSRYGKEKGEQSGQGGFRQRSFIHGRAG